MTEDKILLVALSRGSMKAFDALYRKYAPKVERFAASLLLSVEGFGQEDVDDLAQEIFLKIWQKRATLSGSVDNFNAYLFRMTKNAVLNLLSRKKSIHVALEDSVHISGAEDTLLKTIAAEAQSKVQETVENMPKERQKVFIMSREEGLPNKEIADKLNISPKTVEYHISRALSDIKKILS